MEYDIIEMYFYNFQATVGWNPASAIFIRKAAEILLMLAFLIYKENNF